jgi:PhnB protein
MAQPVSRVPEDFHTLTPHLVVRGVERAVAFYHAAFGAHELLRNLAPDGKTVMHSELLLGDSRFLINDEFPDRGVVSPETLGGTPVTLHLYVDDVDAVFRQAVDAGAQVLTPVQDAFWGDRYGIVRDPFGHRWSVGSRIEDLSPQELQRRAADWSARERAPDPEAPVDG